MIEAVTRAARPIREADALIVGAGAGMGVDSGLPDFRGAEGFWEAYPPLAQLGLSFAQIAQPRWFARDPEMAWGFYGHRLHLYRDTTPHAGFALLRRWAEAKPLGYFVYTSNVDGQFQKAGFGAGRVVEAHGSLHHLQCRLQCRPDVWGADGVEILVDPETLRAAPPLPACPDCGHVARPNVLMFNDGAWQSGRTDAQERRFDRWLASLPRDARLAVVECGAGRAVPTVRYLSDRLAATGEGVTLVRINPRDPQVPRGAVGLPLGALDALTRLADQM